VINPVYSPTRSCDNIKMAFKEMGCGVLDWILLPVNRGQYQAIVNAVWNLRIPQRAENLLSS
jgi:hypothetical protein